MKKFMYLSAGISSIVIALAAVAALVLYFHPKYHPVKVEISGYGYEIKGTMPAYQAQKYVEKTKKELDAKFKPKKVTRLY